jgi:ribosomal subunit interface protein
MNINIKGNISLTSALSDHIDRRLDKIAKIIGKDPSVQCDVEISRTTVHHNKGDIFQAEIHIVGSGKNLFARGEKEDLYAAIDDARDEILAELKAVKGKRLSFVRRGGTQVKAMMKGLWPWGKVR